MGLIEADHRSDFLRAPDGLAQLTSVGHELDRRWRNREYDVEQFADLAEWAIGEVEEIDLMKVLQQHHLKYDTYHFSDFNLRAFQTSRLQIEILYWLQGSTSIHEHGFSGAFKILHGRSLNVEYSFAARKRISQDLWIGDTAVTGSQVMEQGAVHRIASGDRFIHSNFHLGRPVMTMVIRTKTDKRGAPQLSYLPPAIAYNPFNDMTGCREFIEVAAKISAPELFESMLADQLREATVIECVQILIHNRILKGDADRLSRLLHVVRDRYADFGDDLALCIFEWRRRGQARQAYNKLSDLDQQFLMALLANLSDPTQIAERLTQEFPREKWTRTAARLIHGIGLEDALPRTRIEDIDELASVLEGSAGAQSKMSALLHETPILCPLLTPGTSRQSYAVAAE